MNMKIIPKNTEKKEMFFFPVIDSILVNMIHRLSIESLKLFISIGNFINLT